jgi:hypothetical protein
MPLQDRITGALAEARTRPLFIMKLAVRPLLIVGETPASFRRVGLVYGGQFEGERLSGEVLDGGSDWQSVRSDGSTILDVRLNLKTDDGAVIGMTYKGVRRGPPEIIARLDNGEEVDPASYYFRISPMFEVGPGEYDWLNGVLAVGLGHRFADGPVYNIFELL